MGEVRLSPQKQRRPKPSPVFLQHSHPKPSPRRGRCHEVTDEVEKPHTTVHASGTISKSSARRNETEQTFHSQHLISRLTAPASPRGEDFYHRAVSFQTKPIDRFTPAQCLPTRRHTGQDGQYRPDLRFRRRLYPKRPRYIRYPTRPHTVPIPPHRPD